MSTSVEELLLASLGDADWRQDPWHHAYVPETFPPPVARLLAEEFPASLLRRCRRTQGDKPYSFGTASLDGDERARDIGPPRAAEGRARGRFFRRRGFGAGGSFGPGSRLRYRASRPSRLLV